MKKKEAESGSDDVTAEGLGSDRINRILEERKTIASSQTASSRIIKEYCIIETGTNLFGVQIEYMREVFDIRDRADIVPIPFTPPSLLGIINVRGEILPVVSLSEVLGFERDEQYEKMIVTDVGQKAAFPVKGIRDLVQKDVSDIRTIREAANTREIRFLSGEFDLEGDLVLVIDMLKLFASSYFRENA
jgi:chemotaxis signal transduction protein